MELGLGFSLAVGMGIKDKQKDNQALSKVLELNGKYRIFCRVTEDNGVQTPIVAMVPGRSLDAKALGRVFIPIEGDLISVDEYGKFKDMSGLDAWARVARVLFDAQCAREKKAVEAEAAKAAEELGKELDPVKLNESLQKIELEYHGGKAADGTNIVPKKRPIISSLQLKMTNQLLVVKLDAKGAPDVANINYAYLEISDSRARKLLSFCNDANYYDPTTGILEFGLDYTGKDKQEAGRNDYQAIAHSLSLKTQYPDIWESDILPKIEGLVQGKTPQETAMLMRSKNRNVSSSVSPNEVIIAFKKFAATNTAVYGSIDFESDDVKRSAKDFLENGLLDGAPKIKAKMQEVYDANKKNDAPTMDEAAQTIAGDEAHDEKVAEAIKNVESANAGTLTEMMAATGDASLDELGGLGELDD